MGDDFLDIGNLSLPFAVSSKIPDFSASFPRSALACADSGAKRCVVETYPLEVPTAELR
jgi:hypothetical protein